VTRVVKRSDMSLSWPLHSLADALAAVHEVTLFARAAGFPEREAWEIGIAASELATNVTRHAGQGRLTIVRVAEPHPGVELLATDDGPGIPDVDAAMRDDFSQGRTLTDNVAPTQRGGLGSGLGAVERLTDSLAIDSSPAGTTVRAFKRLPEPGRLEPASPPSRKPVLVLGLGNAILRDDGVGIKVARYIAENHPGTGIVVKEAEVAGFALLDLLEGFERAVVVDAVRTADAQPGDVVVFSLDAFSPSLHLVAGHQIDLPTALAMGRELGRDVPSVVHVVGVQVLDDRTFDERCSPAVEAAIPEAARVALRIAASGR